MVSISDAVSNALHEIKPRSALLKTETAFLKLLGMHRQQCVAYQVVAYGRWLLMLDKSRCWQYLNSLSQHWLDWLQQAQTDFATQPVAASYGLLALQAAIVCDDNERQLQLVTLSARQCVPPEYDDEFLQAFFVQEMIRKYQGRADDVVDLMDICQQIEDYLDESPAWLDVYRALAAAEPDDSAFADAFNNWLRLCEQQAEQMDDDPRASYFSNVTKHISLEGLSYLKMAQWVGLTLPAIESGLLPRAFLE